MDQYHPFSGPSGSVRSGWNRPGCALLLFLLLALLSSGAAAVVPGELSSYPDARVVNSRPVSAEAETRVITSQVSEVGDRLRYNEALLVPGEGQVRLLEIGSENTLAEVFGHYREAVLERDGRILFECEGRACGRSAVWANRVFDESRLYGRDGDQSYLAGAWRDEQNRIRLLATYIVRRGNRTISVLEKLLLLPEDYRLPGSNPRERQLLGPFVIPFEMGTAPELSLAPATAGDLRQLAARYPQAVIYVTGFVPADVARPDAAMAQSRLALTAAEKLLEANGITADRQVPLAVGSAIPVAGADRQGPRIEVTIVRTEAADE